MPLIMTELIMQLDPEPKVEFVSARNNAVWSVCNTGQVCLCTFVTAPVHFN